MKKTNKKGFTLAELLIVIAIIAILIAIAIPAFGGALDNAKIQTDHANMRSAYAMAQSANLQGVLYLGTQTAPGTDDVAKLTDTGYYYFMPDGTLSAKQTAVGAGTTLKAYQLKANGKDKANACDASIVCKNNPNGHAVTNYIIIEIKDGAAKVVLGT